MSATRFIARCAAVALFISRCVAAQAASPAPPFDVAYRAWEIVTELGRRNADPALSGECGKTFRPFVIAGLRRQSKQEQDVAAAACVDAARSACANAKLRRTPEIESQCKEFR